MDLSALSDRELTDSLSTILDHIEPEERLDRLQVLTRSLEVHRIQLEIQNRTIRDLHFEVEQMARRYVDLYDHLPIGYMTLTDVGEILEVNATAAKWLESERMPLIGQNLRLYVETTDRDRLLAHLHSCRDSTPSVVELNLCVGDNPPLPVQLSSRMSEAGGEGRIHTAISNISERKRAQRALEDNNREQLAFTYSVSHDMRGPLLTIGSFARILQEDFAAQLAEDARGILGRIEFAATRLDEMLKGLLEISRVATDGIEYESVSLESVVDQTLAELGSSIAVAKAEIIVDRPLPNAHCAHQLIRKIMDQLIANALKFVAPGAAPQIRISAEVRSYTVVLKVSDHGIGMPAKHLDRIFNVFERLQSRTQYPGNGIGLTVVRRAVERMNGRVHVESEVGLGTTVFVELPRA